MAEASALAETTIAESEMTPWVLFNFCWLISPQRQTTKRDAKRKRFFKVIRRLIVLL